MSIHIYLWMCSHLVTGVLISDRRIQKHTKIKILLLKEKTLEKRFEDKVLESKKNSQIFNKIKFILKLVHTNIINT
jgi:hypothetical protein